MIITDTEAVMKKLRRMGLNMAGISLNSPMGIAVMKWYQLNHVLYGKKERNQNRGYG
jgi:hypothetical protein